MFFNETEADNYNWETDGIYILQEYDPVQGGEEGISNVPAKALALRTRSLHNRITRQENEIAALKAAVETLMQNK